MKSREEMILEIILGSNFLKHFDFDMIRMCDDNGVRKAWEKYVEKSRR